MSSAEMTMLVFEAAETSPSQRWKDRVHAAARVLNLPFARAKAFYYREPRRVTAEEMDNAREAIRTLRDQRKRDRELDHLTWLQSEIARHRAAGTGIRGVHADGLEHFLRVARGEAGAVAVRAEPLTLDQRRTYSFTDDDNSD